MAAPIPRGTNRVLQGRDDLESIKEPGIQEWQGFRKVGSEAGPPTFWLSADDKEQDQVM